jgi:hypothetical protein
MQYISLPRKKVKAQQNNMVLPVPFGLLIQIMSVFFILYQGLFAKWFFKDKIHISTHILRYGELK